MVKTKGPQFNLKMSGTYERSVLFQKNGVVRSYPTLHDARSPKQGDRRQVWGCLNRAFGMLTSEAKQHIKTFPHTGRQWNSWFVSRAYSHWDQTVAIWQTFSDDDRSSWGNVLGGKNWATHLKLNFAQSPPPAPGLLVLTLAIAFYHDLNDPYDIDAQTASAPFAPTAYNAWAFHLYGVAQPNNLTDYLATVLPNLPTSRRNEVGLACQSAAAALGCSAEDVATALGSVDFIASFLHVDDCCFASETLDQVSNPIGINTVRSLRSWSSDAVLTTTADHSDLILHSDLGVQATGSQSYSFYHLGPWNGGDFAALFRNEIWKDNRLPMYSTGNSYHSLMCNKKGLLSCRWGTRGKNDLTSYTPAVDLAASYNYFWSSIDPATNQLASQLQNDPVQTLHYSGIIEFDPDRCLLFASLANNSLFFWKGFCKFVMIHPRPLDVATRERVKAWATAYFT